MKQKEAKTLIVQEWERWLQTQSIDPDHASGRDTLKFYFELQDHKSALLDFQSRGQDKWRIIHAWLLGAARLSDHWMMPAPRMMPTRKARPIRSKSGAKT